MRRFAAVLLILSTCFGSSLFAQADTTKYKERWAAVNQEIWGWKLPAFANHKVPAEYANESSVILARHATIEADSKKKMSWAMLGARRNWYYNSTVRELVKINDKAALDEYSQLNFRQFKKLNRWISATATTFVGARIIKPDGTVRNVSIDESVVLRTDKNDLERKLAIGDLQVGDLLDYYVRTEEFSLDQREPERLIFVFGDDHPILSYSIHCDIGDKYAVEYRSMNKAPDAKQSTNEDKDCILDIALQNLPAVPTGFWMSSLRDLPAFRINVLAGSKEHTGRAMGEVVRNVPMKDIVTQAWGHLGSGPGDAVIEQQMSKMLHDYDKHFARLPTDSLIYLVYYMFRFNFYYNQVDGDLDVGEGRNHSELKSFPYLNALDNLYRHFGILPDFVVISSRYGPDVQQVMSSDDLVPALMIRGDKPLFITNDNMFTYPGYVPGYLEGQPAIEILNNHTKKREQVDLSTLAPLSTAAENLHKEDLQVKLADDMQLLRIKRKTTLTGRMKVDEQLHLLNFEDYYEYERNALRVEKSIVDQLKKARKNKNVSEDYETALKKARASLKDRFKEEVSGEFEEDPKEMITWKVENPGIRNYAPDLVYSTEFTMDNLLQRAGNNFLLNIGKIVNSPLKLTPSQRTRKVDVYMPYARTLDCSVNVAIPAGFTVVGADKLNKTVENDCGSLTTTAQLQGNQLVIHFKRVYRHNTETSDKWNQLLAIIDAASDFAGQKVLLKKG
ncbi:MAG TPA: DUF3857 domain-containing protein [Puia sp.]|jgi:hypothetical protein|nr:DUF3857 domain-containing protein [Puia sp.]